MAALGAPQGKVVVSALDQDGREVQLAVLGRGECVGESALVIPQRRALSVRERAPAHAIFPAL